MKIKLNSVNRPTISKTLLLTTRNDEILISSEDGIEIASLSVEIMDKETESLDSKKWEASPTENFWIRFHPVSSVTDKQYADFIVKD